MQNPRFPRALRALRAPLLLEVSGTAYAPRAGLGRPRLPKARDNSCCGPWAA